ncbi:MAG: hypothetical protein IVW53_01335 [Chloroflexi bacterium]|nr:hypothetical protein [Chloroflexota bacterium]
MTVSAPPAASQGAAATPSATWTTYNAPTGTTLGGVWVGPDGTVYTSPTSSTLPNALLALGPDGRPKLGWPVALPDPYMSTVAFGPDGSIYVATITKDGTAGHLVVIGPDGAIRPGWPYPTTGSTGQLLVGPDGTVYALLSSKTDGDSLLALNSDGRLKSGWPYRLATTVKFGSQTIPVDHQVTVRPDGTVYVTGAPGLVALDADGRVKPGWPFAASAWYNRPVFAADGTIYIGTGPRGPAVLSTIVALDQNGSPKRGWRSPTIYGNPTLGLGPDGTLYAAEGCCGNPAERILAFGSDGSARAAWSVYKVPVSGGIIVGLDIGATGDVYVTVAPPPGKTGSNRLVGLGPDGRVLPSWPTTVEGPLWAQLFAPDGTAYFVSGNTITALVPDGHLRPGWPYTIPGTVTYPWVTLSPGGGLYVVTSTSVIWVGPDGTTHR